MNSSFSNADKIQSAINDDLFPQVAHVSDVKQVLEFMGPVAQPLTEEQIRGLVLLEQLGLNKKLHPNGNPYKSIIDKICKDYKVAVANTDVYLKTIEELIPKPPKPIILAEKAEKDGKAVKK